MYLSLLLEGEYARDPNTRLNWLSFLLADGQELHVRQWVLCGRKQHLAARRSALKGIQPRGVERRRRTKRDADPAQDSYHARYTNALSLSLSLSLSFSSSVTRDPGIGKPRSRLRRDRTRAAQEDQRTLPSSPWDLSWEIFVQCLILVRDSRRALIGTSTGAA